jgi:hypothetical protein
MGKSISDSDYKSANERLNNCPVKDCQNHTNDKDGSFCGGCKSAFRVKKEYERSHQGQHQAR